MREGERRGGGGRRGEGGRKEVRLLLALLLLEGQSGNLLKRLIDVDRLKRMEIRGKAEEEGKRRNGRKGDLLGRGLKVRDVVLALTPRLRPLRRHHTLSTLE